MSIRIRLVFLLATLTALSATMMLLFHYSEEKNLRLLAEAEQRNAEVLFDRVFELRSAPLAIWTEDYTRWDDMVTFVATPDETWARENLVEGLATFRLTTVWVFGADFVAVYPDRGGNREGEGVHGLGTPDLRELFAHNQFPHFFAVHEDSLIEVRGAPIHGTSDLRRELPASGYVLVSRVWSREDMAELARATGLTLSLADDKGVGQAGGAATRRNGSVGFVRRLPGMDARKTGASIVASYDSAILKALAGNSMRERLLVVAVPFVFLLGLWVALHRWVHRPLGEVTDALRRGSSAGLERLAADRTEWSEVASLIVQATAQREELQDEVARRERTEAQLVASREQLEERVLSRTAELSRANQDLQREAEVRRKAEAEARQARDEWERTFDAIPDLVAILDGDRRIVRANRAMQELLSRADSIAGPCMLCARPGGTPTWECVLRQGGGAPVSHSAEVTQDALGLDFFVTVASLVDEEGALTGCVQVAHDITARKRVERALEVSEERLRLAVEGADLGLWDLNVQTGEAVVSDRYATMLGLDPCTLRETNATWLQRLHPEDRERVGVAYRGYVEGTLPEYKVEFRQRTASGDWVWIYSAGRIVARDESGRPLRMAGTHTDITARKQAEEALTLAVRRLEEQEAIIRRSTVTVWKARNAPGWPIEYVSDTITALGYVPEDFTSGRVPFATFIHPEDFPALLRAVDECLRSGAAEFSSEFRVRSASGEVRWRADRAWPLRRPDGEVTHFQGVSVDITERKRAEENLRESEARYRDLAEENARLLEEARRLAAAKHALLEEVNHRVKNNLLQIRRLIDLESRSLGESGGEAKRGLAGLAARIDGQVTVHRLLSSVEWTALPIGNLARTVVTSQLEAAPHHGSLQVRFTGDALDALLPPEQAMAVASILAELTTNSVKYAFEGRPGGSLHIDASLERAEPPPARPLVRLRYGDDGPGYPAEVLAGHREGVGLRLVRGTVTSPLAGSLTIESDGGAWTTVTFRQALLET